MVAQGRAAGAAANMTTELTMLALSVALGFVYIFAGAIASTAHRGSKWNVGPRDGDVPPLQGVAGRLERALRNFLETFPLFVAAVLVADAANRHGPSAVWGTQLYFWGRVIYLPVYAAGIPVIRSIVWTVATIGIALVLLALI
jgi:uncharacterized MAPEG superfamily protein